MAFVFLCEARRASLSLSRHFEFMMRRAARTAGRKTLLVRATLGSVARARARLIIKEGRDGGFGDGEIGLFALEEWRGERARVKDGVRARGFLERVNCVCAEFSGVPRRFVGSGRVLGRGGEGGLVR